MDHDTTPPDEPKGSIYEQVVAYLDEQAEIPAVFEWRPDDMGAEPADWITANPSLGVPPSPASAEILDAVAHPPEPWTWATVSQWVDYLAEHDKRFALTDWQKWFLVEVGKRGRVDPQFTRILFHESSRRQFRRTQLEAELVSRAVRGTTVNGPVGVIYDECTEPFLSELAWDRARPNPRNDPEMLNRVIDDIATDVTTKIARTECPKFPRVE
jgi:hypothetical protein